MKQVIGGMDMGTVVIGVLLFGIVGLILHNMIKAKRQGKSVQCGCDCSHCSGHCH